LIWTGGVEVVVRDQGGDVKHDFNKNDIEITLPAVIEGLSEGEQKDLCLGSTDERSSGWDCNADETQVKKGGKILTVKRRFDHLSTFSVLLGTTSGCSLALWTASVVLIVVVPLFFASVAFVLYRFYCGRALIYGYRGREISMITKKAQQQQPQVKDISGIQNAA
jgi:hypothetical protein